MDYFCVMGKVRASILSKFIAVITGLVFLNMGFFLNEVRLLKLDVSHSQMVENIVKMMSGAGFEEEKDSASEGGENPGAEQFIDLHLAHHALLLIDRSQQSQRGHCHHLDSFIGTLHADIATPPPKIA